MSQQQQIFISPESGLHGIRKWNLHLTVGFLSFLVMLFHFTAVYFFTLQLESVALVGIFLGIGNLCAMLLDVPAGILQRYYRSRTLYISWAVAHIIAMLIFANFIFAVNAFISQSIEDEGLWSVIRFFLLDGLNWYSFSLLPFVMDMQKRYMMLQLFLTFSTRQLLISTVLLFLKIIFSRESVHFLGSQ